MGADRESCQSIQLILRPSAPSPSIDRLSGALEFEASLKEAWRLLICIRLVRSCRPYNEFLQLETHISICSHVSLLVRPHMILSHAFIHVTRAPDSGVPSDKEFGRSLSMLTIGEGFLAAYTSLCHRYPRKVQPLA